MLVGTKTSTPAAAPLAEDATLEHQVADLAYEQCPERPHRHPRRPAQAVAAETPGGAETEPGPAQRHDEHQRLADHAQGGEARQQGDAGARPVRVVGP